MRSKQNAIRTCDLQTVLVLKVIYEGKEGA
jgi:hypothetical protein